MPVRDYKKIRAYQLANQLVIEIYKETKKYPKEELYGIISQIRRAVVSVAANIVEGANRQHKKEYLNFLYNSRGSLAEVEYFINLSTELEFITAKKQADLMMIHTETSKVLFGLIKSVEKEV